MATSLPKATASMRALYRGFASSAKTLSESASSGAAAAPASASAAPRPRSNNQSQRSSQSSNRISDRLHAVQRNRSSQQNGQSNGGSRNAGNDRRNKRLPSVFDAASASAQSRPSGGAGVKSLTHGSRKLPAPVPRTDWNSPLFSKPGFERLLVSAPRASSAFVPNLAAAATSAPAASGKGKGKAAAEAPAAKGAKLNLPGIKTAVNALKLHIRPGGRNVLGPVHNPTAVASGFMSHNRPAISPRGATDNTSLAEELKAARIALQNEQIGGSYERFESQSVLKAAGVKDKASTSAKAVRDAAQALALNADLAPEGKGFVAKTIAERLSA